MPNPTIPKEIQALVSTYQNAELRLIQIIAKQRARGNVTTYRRNLLKQISAELQALNKYADGWTKGYIQKVYDASAAKVYAAYRAMGVSVAETALNAEAVSKIVENTVSLFEDANRHLGRILDDEIRKAGVQATAEKLSVGDTVKQMKKNLIGKLTDNGITSITYRNGRRVKADAYAELVARSTTRETTNRAAMQTVQDLGYDLVQMSNHSSSCPICATFEGRVYSISGKDKRYPPLDKAFAPPYANIHPNCAHVIVPYIEEFDDNAAKTREFSNRSFETDPRSQAEKDRYERSQQIKAERREDRNTYEQMKLLLPNNAPKSFAAFRSMKSADSENYRMLMHDYIYVKKTVEKTT